MKPKKLYIKISILLLFIVHSCNTNNQNDNYTDDMDNTNINTNFYYNLDNPDKKYELPQELVEISGISYIGKGKIACVQDELGILYIFDENKNEVIKTTNFGDEGDYEDIELIDDKAYILRSDGTLFVINNYDSEDYKVDIHKTLLTSKNDAEGLAYNKSNNSLLIACKGKAKINKEDKSLKKKRAIYQKKLDDLNSEIELYRTIDLKELDKMGGDKSFRISGLAINPKTNTLFVIGTVGKLLIELDSEGEIMSIKQLDKNIFSQPEGICFSPNGDMYISNEGKNEHANILKFKYINI